MVGGNRGEKEAVAFLGDDLVAVVEPDLDARLRRPNAAEDEDVLAVAVHRPPAGRRPDWRLARRREGRVAEGGVPAAGFVDGGPRAEFGDRSRWPCYSEKRLEVSKRGAWCRAAGEQRRRRLDADDAIAPVEGDDADWAVDDWHDGAEGVLSQRRVHALAVGEIDADTSDAVRSDSGDRQELIRSQTRDHEVHRTAREQPVRCTLASVLTVDDQPEAGAVRLDRHVAQRIRLRRAGMAQVRVQNPCLQVRWPLRSQRRDQGRIKGRK